MIQRLIQKKLEAWQPKWRPLRFKATLIGIIAAAVVVPLLLLSIPYLEIFNDMAVQPVGKPQGLYGWFVDESRIVERPPVAGTMPMDGVDPYPIEVEEGKEPEAAKLAGETLTNPLRRDPSQPVPADVLSRGQKIFNTICVVCHGPRADGDGSIVGPDLFPAPPSLHTEEARGFPDGRLFHVITKGQNKMPSYADVLDPTERWAVVLYVRALQLAKQMPASDEGGD